MVQEVYAGGITGGVVAGVVISQAIPDWVKTQFEWYVNEEIDEKTLLTSMNWMFDNNVMHLSEKAAIEVQQMKEENNDLKIQVEELQAAIAIPNLIEARKGANEAGSGTCTNYGVYGEATGDEIMVILFPAPGASTMPEDEIMVLLRPSTGMHIDPNAEIMMYYSPGDPHYGNYMIGANNVQRSDDAHKKWIDVLSFHQQMGIMDNGQTTTDLCIGEDCGTAWSTTSQDGSKNIYVRFTDAASFASNTVDDIMTKGGTISAWEDGIAAFSDIGYKYVPPYTTSESSLYVENRLDGEMVDMAMYTVIEKESQIIDAELKIVEQWLEIIEEKHTTDTAGTSTDYYGRTTTETGTTNYNESDLNFISRILESSDQKIMSLQTGLTVLEQKLQTAGDDAALANIDLQNMLQKQQQTLQTMSNVSKMLHDTAMSVIQKIG